MKRNTYVFGFVIIIMAIITIVGCSSLGGVLKSTEFPAGFIGTWERAFQTPFSNTLKFTSKTLKPSNQSNFRNLVDVSGDYYSLINANDSNHRTRLFIRLVNDNLEIIEDFSTTPRTEWNGSMDDWTGTWRRK